MSNILLLYRRNKPVVNWSMLGSLPSGLTFSRSGNATMFDATGKMVWAPANMFLNSATLATQSVTVVVGQSYTMSAYGTGSVALSNGASGTWTGTGEGNRVSLAFTATTTTATFTVTGSVTSAQLEPTSYNSPQPYIATTSSAYYGPRFDCDPVTGAVRGLLLEESRTNILLNSAALSTQSVTVTAQAYTLSFYGTGQVVLSGTASATVVGTGVFPSRKTHTFTPTEGTLTLTVSGTVEYAQLETGSFATSYIPTYGATATRAADSLYTTSIPWFNPAQGTMSVDFTPMSIAAAFAWPLAFTAGDDVIVNSMGFTFNTGGTHWARIRAASWDTTTINFPTASDGVRYKDAFAYSSAEARAASNGVSGVSDTTVTLPSGITRMRVGKSTSIGVAVSGHYRAFKYWNYALSSAQLQSVTKV